MGHCQRKVCNFIVGEKNGEFALKIDSEQLSEQEQGQEYLTNLVYENNSLAGERERIKGYSCNTLSRMIWSRSSSIMTMVYGAQLLYVLYIPGGGLVGLSGLAWKLSLSMCDLVDL